MNRPSGSLGEEGANSRAIERVDCKAGHERDQSWTDSPYARRASPTNVCDQREGESGRSCNHEVDHRGVNRRHDSRAMAEIATNEHSDDQVGTGRSDADHTGTDK